MEFLPLGTIIKVNDYKLCVIGYTSAKKDSADVAGHLAVSYPLGFTNIDKVFFIPCHQKVEILAEGFSSNGSKKLLDTMAKAFTTLKDVPEEEIEKSREILKNALSSQKEESE